ncbi:unnamed protein product [Tilletia controversa]|uniref:Exosome complex protein n=3 Tax=Tilletia TaxID=13289 RepID=A0A8X7N1H9_9BASI|nr:hypothetical protein CF336_g668 [Tilletia laevis]KAE8206030.1 hypothetical protein CF328_g156 [Tilletia controversa]KAE8265612.1 hypothetical protein A4X03_0g148 [Tilletia caries]KAE8208414.1 hypothetical protein CF335_g427 [Tilletia laevis]KAE8255433.1 hypothetical protein A4X06_0g429 [Tilletia controversa]
MDGLADPTPTADALIPQLTQLQAILTQLIPSSSSSSSSQSQPSLPSYEDLLATIESSSSTDNDNPLTPRLHAARLNASLAYLILDSLWILMKTRGINIPAHHPLHIELERARLYLDKVKRASQPEHRREHDPVMAAQVGNQRRLDTGPAGRFIKAALASQPKGTLTRFADDGKEGGDGDEDVGMAVVAEDDTQVQLGKRKARDAGSKPTSTSTSTPPSGTLAEDPRKKKRAAMDPYTEYDAAPPQRQPKAIAEGEDNDDDDGEGEDGEDDAADRSTASDAKKKGKKKKRGKGKGKKK